MHYAEKDVLPFFFKTLFKNNEEFESSVRNGKLTIIIKSYCRYISAIIIMVVLASATLIYVEVIHYKSCQYHAILTRKLPKTKEQLIPTSRSKSGNTRPEVPSVKMIIWPCNWLSPIWPIGPVTKEKKKTHYLFKHKLLYYWT